MTDGRENIKTYAVMHLDSDVRSKSRSGGTFTALTDFILSQNGVVYGCVMDTPYHAKHVRADNVDIRNAMRGSKYIQSDLGNTFRNVITDLKEGKLVLFSGTSCQISALKGITDERYHDNLYTVDIVCHGVPSPMVWKDYLCWLEKKYHGKTKQVDFRDKNDFGWKTHYEKVVIQQKNGLTINITGEIFKKLFFSHLILRPACFQCPYKSVFHPGDITIGDYWGIDKVAPEYNDNKGVSLVLVNNEKGQRLFDHVKSEIKYKETDIYKSLQAPLKAPFEEPDLRKQFWAEYSAVSFDYLIKKYLHLDWFRDFKNHIKKYRSYVLFHRKS